MSVERKEWKPAPADWPRQQPDVADEERAVIRRRAPAKEAGEPERGVPGPRVRGKRTQTGEGSTSGWS